MFHSIVYLKFLGLSILAWGGIGTFVFFVLTMLSAHLRQKGNFKIPYKAHPILAIITFIMASIHGIIGILALLGY